MKEILKLTLYGQPYIKKNNQRTIWHKTLKRTIVVYPAAYTAWRKDALMQLGLCRNGYWQKKIDKPIDFPIIMKAHFYNKTKHRRDLSAMYEGIQDILVEAGILEDDNCNIIIGHDGSRMFYDKENPRIELWLLKPTEEEPI
jgi:Holliday junction resolvase RusA-like endonuclease